MSKPSRLTADQIRCYEQNGYLAIANVVDANDLEALREITRTILEASRDVRASNAVYDLGPGHSRATPRVRRIKNPTKQHPVYDRLMRSDAILDIVADLVGESIRFDHAKLNFKPKDGSASIGWHQDWAFYPHTNDDLLAVGVMLEDCAMENGPLMVVPGSHKGPVYDHHCDGVFVGGIDIKASGLDASSAVPLTGRAGSITVHHVRTVHGSAENLSNGDRALLLYSYAAVDAWPLLDMDDLEAFNQRILRGTPTIEPRMEPVPIRISLPRVPRADSIFESQAAAKRTSVTEAV